MHIRDGFSLQVVFVISFIFFGHYGNANPINITEANYKIKYFSLLGVELKVASFEIHTNDNLYLYDSNVCPATNCTQAEALHVSQLPCVCDYSSSQCGQNGYQKVNPSKECSCENSYCDASYNWTHIPSTVNYSQTVEMAQEETRHWRIFVNNSCDGFRLRVNRQYGFVKFFMGTQGPENVVDTADWLVASENEYSINFLICPSAQHFVVGTYFITIYAESQAKFELQVFDAYDPLPNSPTSSCSIINATVPHACVEDAVPTHGQCSPDVEFVYYYINLTGCQPLFVYVNTYGQGFADIDLYTGLKPAPYFAADAIHSAGDFVSYVPGEDWITRVICPANPSVQNWTLVYITVDCWYVPLGANFTVYASTREFEYWEKVPLTEISQFEASYRLLDSARVSLKGSDSAITCDSFPFSCDQLWFSSPSMDLVPFYPVPNPLAKLPEVGPSFSSISGNLTLPYSASSQMISFHVLLSYSIDEAEVEEISEEEISEALLRFNGRVGNLNGDPLFGNYTGLTPVTISCNYENFSQAQEMMNDVFEEFETATDPDSINSVRYKLDSITFYDSWFGCQATVDRLITAETSATENIPTSSCYEVPGTDAFDQDPCCSNVAAWSQTCIPRTQPVQIVSLEPQKQEISKQCSSAVCVESYMEDYIIAKESFTHGDCAIFPTDVSQEFYAVQKIYRNCKAQTYKFENVTASCYLDSDCNFNGTFYQCHLITHECLIPHTVLEKLFLECLVSQMTTAQEQYIQQLRNISASKSDPTFVTEWQQKISEGDCVLLNSTNVDLTFRDRFQISPPSFSCAEASQCEIFFCEDSSCLYREQTCYTWCGAPEIVRESSPESVCSSSYVCNWDSNLCEDLGSADCISLCSNSSTNFCGLCEDDNCIKLPSIPNSFQCQNTDACVFHDGTILTNSSQSECQQYAQCTQKCGFECQSLQTSYSVGICYSTLYASSVSCTSVGGSWTLDQSDYICIFSNVSNREDCKLLDAVWESCGELSVYDCLQCESGNCTQLNQHLMTCQVFEKECANSTECENSGYCSDRLVSINGPEKYYGACILSRIPPLGEYQFLDPIPFCYDNEQVFPNGCIDYSIKSPEECANRTDRAATWRWPSENQTSCLASYGCLDLEPQTNQPRFSPKDFGNCTSSYNLQGSWEPYFDWTAARWIQGIPRKLQWKVPQAFPKYSWTSTISFPFALNDFYTGSSTSVALEAKSNALCQYQQTSPQIATVACACTGREDTGKCFSLDNAPLISEMQACYQTNSTGLIADAGYIIFTEDSVQETFACVSLFISLVSASNYRTSTDPSLSANFLAFLKPPDFALFNEKDAVVGLLLSDGVEISVGGDERVNSMTLCLTFRNKLTKDQPEKFSVFDVATTLDFQKFEPLQLEVSLTEDKNALCIELNNMSSTTPYFAIARVDNYETANKKYFDSVSFGINYTLAVFFLLASFFALGKIIHYGYYFTKYSSAFILEHILIIFIWMFLIVRAIYFFVLGAGLDSLVIDYFMVALPTFFYFTAFSIIVVLWANVSMRNFSADVQNFNQSIRRWVIIINIVLYLIFIALVISFQFSTESNSSACEGRDGTGNDQNNKKKRTISILYAVIIAVISLAIGVLFFVFGRGVIRKFSRMSKRKNKNTKIRLFVVTGVCSVSFILHSIFILVISVQEVNPFFSFFGLLLTELVPALFITSWLHFHRQAQIKESSQNRGKTVDVELKRKGKAEGVQPKTSESSSDYGSSVFNKKAEEARVHQNT